MVGTKGKGTASYSRLPPNRLGSHECTTGSTNVSLNRTPATFTVKSDTLITAIVPAGATTGYVTVTKPSGTLTSNVPFHVIP